MRPAMQRSRFIRRLFAALTGCAILVALATITGRLSDFDAVAKLHARGEVLPDGLTISDVVTVSLQAGEVQSTVVPPGQKSECPQGRLLISGDYSTHPPKVVLRDLDKLSSWHADATFNKWEPLGINPDNPDNGSRRIKSNDHDLIALPNGNVLLIKMGQTRWPIDPEPDWYDSAYKLATDKGDPEDETDDKLVVDWGPGARSEVFVWRSENCGESFEFVSSIDTALLDDDYGTADDGSGGLPQHSKLEEPDGLWQMGGTDGPLARVDPLSGRVFITIGLVGFRPSTEPGPFSLSGTELDRTVVMMSLDHGDTWDRAAVLPFSAWRLDVVPRANYTLAFADHGWNKDLLEGNAFVLPDYPIGYGILSAADAPAYLAPTKLGQWGWGPHPFTNRSVLYKADKEDDDYMNTNVATQTVLTRSPSSKNLLMAYPETIGNGLDGYNLFIYDEQSSWVQLFPIVPTASDSDSFVLHPTPVDAGVGPLLLYWYDVDTGSKTAAIRGRLITRDDQHTLDFGISRDQSAHYAFDVTKGTPFYGDYHTAGAYYVKTFPADWKSYEYHYYPVWIEPDGNVRVAHITFNKPTEVTMSPAAESVGFVRQLGDNRIILREQVDVSRLTIRRTEEEEESPRQVIRPEGER